MTNPVLVEVTRGGQVESRHRGAVAIVDAAGRHRVAIGDVRAAVFPRSAIKAFQAIPLVESGAADRFGLTDAELALACGSHNGEPRHVAAATRMLAAAGRSEADLRCGASWPLDRSAANALIREGGGPRPLYDNCSGKHAGFICLACHLGADPEGYTRPDHRVQREVASTLSALTGISLGADVCAVDGCSAPTWAVPLENLAQAFARFVTGEGMAPGRARAAARLRACCRDHPDMVAGTGRICTQLLTSYGERLFAKGGAEGVYCCAFPQLGLGVAVKCDDGANRAAESIASAIVAAFLGEGEAVVPIMSRVGDKVGEIRPVAELLESLR